MHALNLDFVRRPSPLHGLGIVMLLLSMATAAYLGQVYLRYSADLADWEAKWRSLQKAQHRNVEAGANPKAAEWERLQTELKIANRVIGRLSLPWDSLFRNVEASVDEQVALLNVEPDTERHELRITAEAKNLVAMLDYVKRLQALDSLSDAHVVGHQIQQQDAQRPVRFVVNAQWKEAK